MGVDTQPLGGVEASFKNQNPERMRGSCAPSGAPGVGSTLDACCSRTDEFGLGKPPVRTTGDE
jgi:hypothetical protein